MHRFIELVSVSAWNLVTVSKVQKNLTLAMHGDVYAAPVHWDLRGHVQTAFPLERVTKLENSKVPTKRNPHNIMNDLWYTKHRRCWSCESKCDALNFRHSNLGMFNSTQYRAPQFLSLGFGHLISELLLNLDVCSIWGTHRFNRKSRSYFLLLILTVPSSTS